MVARLEGEIDACEAQLEPLRKFILPGGSTAGAVLHLARTVARRAERACVALAGAEPVSPETLRYLNRLSDLCFVLARLVNRRAGATESNPTFGRDAGSDHVDRETKELRSRKPRKPE
jgi:cob(I)alamin adenosyltransferase